MTAPVRPATGEIMEAALEWARLGVPVFLLRPGDKRPLPGSNGYKDATIDEADIRARFAEHPDANYGLYLHGAGLCAVDPDGAAGEAAWAKWQAEHGEVPPTHEHITPRGGRHLIFRGVLPSKSNNIAPHVDTRGEGGHIVGDGCVIDERSGLPEHYWGTYAEVFDCPPAADLPASVAQAANSKSKHEPAKAAPGEVNQRDAIARAKSRLRSHPPAIQGLGGDDRTYLAAQFAKDAGVAEENAPEALAEWNECCEPSWEPDELAEKIEHAYRYGQNEEGCHALPETPKEWEAFAAEDAQRTPGITFKPTEEPTDRAERVARLRGRSILAYRDLPPLEYHDRSKMLPKMPGGAGGLVIGRSGAGKTTVTLAVLGDAIQNGARVLYCASEGAYGLGKQRLPALAHALGLPLEKLDAQLSLVDEAVNLLDREDVAALIEATPTSGRTSWSSTRWRPAAPARMRTRPLRRA